jgi:quercetin dioxygenase-like cupin family protein
MIEQRPYVRRKSLDNSYQILGHVFSFLAEEKDTGGQFTLIEVNPFPGTEPPPHIRRQDDEGFYVLQGEMEHQIDGETVVARPGDFVLAPQGSLRSFRFRTPEARLLLLLAPGGAEEGLREIGRPAPSLIPQFPEGGLPSPEKMQSAFAAHGVEFGMPPVPGAPMPQLALNEALARRAGWGRSLWSMDQLVTVLAGGADTHDRFALIESVVGRGRELPPHVHGREDAAYYVLEGEATVFAAGEPLPASAGSLVFVPKGTPHSLRVQTEEARLLTLASPAGLEGWFQASATPALEMTLPPPALHGAAAAELAAAGAGRHGVEIFSR